MDQSSSDIRILVVDDNEDILIATDVLLGNHFSNVTLLNSSRDVISELKKHTYAVALLDMNYTQGAVDGEEGLKLLQDIKNASPATQVILMTAYAGINLAVDAMKAGASDFVVKPWHNNRLITTILSAVNTHQNHQRIKTLEQTQETLLSDATRGFNLLIGESPGMLELKKMIQSCAKTDASILITGESGTGKEVVANCIHQESNRAAKPFISVDMGAITETLFESELFGHTKGAFSGAYSDKVGRFISANKGTLFLDELGNLPYAGQVKLLRVLQERMVTPVGGKEGQKVDIRLISATNENLQKNIEAGDFRQDLLYRINTIELRLPPLRERKEDIPILATFFLDKYKRKYKKSLLVLTEPLKYQLHDWHWPGNVRELQHMMERAVILSTDTLIDFTFMLPSSGKNNNSVEQGEQRPLEQELLSLKEIEKQAILNALKATQNNICKASNILGINRASLYRKKLKHDIE